MIKIMKYLNKKEWLLIVISIFFVITQVGLDLTIPDYMSKITMALQSTDSAMGDIYQYGGMMILLAFLSLFASVITAICATKIATDFSAELRERLFNKVQSFSMVGHR